MAEKVIREAAATFFTGGRTYTDGDKIELTPEKARLLESTKLLRQEKKTEKTKQDKPERTQQVEAEGPPEGRSTKKRQTKGS